MIQPFTTTTIQCGCQKIRSVFRVLMYLGYIILPWTCWQFWRGNCHSSHGTTHWKSFVPKSLFWALDILDQLFIGHYKPIIRIVCITNLNWWLKPFSINILLEMPICHYKPVIIIQLQIWIGDYKPFIKIL